MRPPDRTRYAQHPGLVGPSSQVNNATRRAPSSFRGYPGPLFDLLQGEMAEVLERETRPGVMVFAASNDLGMVGTLWLQATDELRGGCVGRHTKADLSLPFDDALSLRHFVVLTWRRGQQTRVRLIDLRSEAGVVDERNEETGDLECEGPLVVGASSWWFFILPTGEGALWDRAAPSAWATLRPRSFAHRRSDALEASTPEAAVALRDDVTLVTKGPGPVGQSGEFLAVGERPDGVLQLACEGAELSLSLGARALERGLLLGREMRCDGSAVLGANEISRVHGLVLRAPGGEVVLLDVGSTNGVHAEAGDRKMISLEGQKAWLSSAATVRWIPKAQDGGGK